MKLFMPPSKLKEMQLYAAHEVNTEKKSSQIAKMDVHRFGVLCAEVSASLLSRQMPVPNLYTVLCIFM